MNNLGRFLFAAIFLTVFNSGNSANAQSLGGGSGTAGGDLTLTSCSVSSGPTGSGNSVINVNFTLAVTAGQRIQSGTFIAAGVSGGPTSLNGIAWTYTGTVNGFDNYTGTSQATVTSGTYDCSGTVTVADPDTGAKTTFTSNVIQVTVP